MPETATNQAVVSATESALAAARQAATDTELNELIWVMAVPVLIADYSPLVERFAGFTAEEVTQCLSGNDELIACLDLIKQRAESAPWAMLYGSGGDDSEAPALGERLADPAQYPGLKDHLIQQLSAPWSGKTSIVFEHLVPTGRDTNVVVLSHWNVVISGGKPDWTRVAIVDLDVTELRTAEHNLAQAQRLEAIGSIAAGVAHELNTPLQYVSDNLDFLAAETAGLLDFVETTKKIAMKCGASELAEAASRIDLEFLQEELPDAIEQSQQGVGAMRSIVMGLKEFSHAGSEEKEAADVNHLIETAVAVCRNEWKYVAKVTFAFQEDLPKVEVLEQELRQVVLNLVVNAAHAIGEHKGDGGEIRITTKDHGDRVTIAISDDGGGVPEHLRERIFDPFFTTKEVGKGSGQGLAMARKSIAGRHQGRLDLDVEEGHGSTFTISIPR